MFRKKIKKVVLLLMVILFLLLGGCGKNKVLYIEYGDNISEFSAYTLDGQCVNLNKEGKCVYFYLSDTCGSCIDMLELYEQLVNLNLEENIIFYCLWEDEMPVNKVEKLNVNPSMILTLDGKYTFHSVKPHFYIVENGVVSFFTQDYQEMIDKVFTYISDMDKLKQTAFENLIGCQNIEKKALLFESEGLGSISDKQREKLKQLDIVEIYTVTDYRDEEAIFDKYGIYRKIFDVEWLPTIAWWDNSMLYSMSMEDLH